MIPRLSRIRLPNHGMSVRDQEQVKKPARPRRRQHSRRGQSLVEFALAVPILLLFIFGIAQAALAYKAKAALDQAATDAAHIIAAQSTSGNQYATSPWQADGGALARIRQDLVAQNLNNIQSIDIFSANPTTGSANTIAIANSVDLLGGPFPNPITSNQGTTPPLTNTITLDNQYLYAPSGTAACQVDQFALNNALQPNSSTPGISKTAADQYWQPCALPWNGSQFVNKTNDNGRHDQRCNEDTVGVKIVYTYASSSFPVHWSFTLTASDFTSLEPRQYLGNNSTFQATAGLC